MSKICTSIEQSKKLKELGIDVNSADMHWQYIEEDNGQLQWFYFPKDFSINENESIPAWSLSALLGLMPKFSLEKDVSNNEGYQLHYNYDTTYYDNLVNAAFEMVVWLKENEKI